ncbi:Flp family type IVb pilin [Methylocystis sp. S23]
MLLRFLRDEAGAAATEYAAIASFLSIVVLAGATAIGRLMSDKHFETLLKAWLKAQA